MKVLPDFNPQQLHTDLLGSSADIMGLNSFIHLNTGPELIFMSSVLSQTCELDFDAVVQILAGYQIFSQTDELELLNVMFLTRKR